MLIRSMLILAVALGAQAASAQQVETPAPGAAADPSSLLPAEGIGNGTSRAPGYQATPQEALRVAQGQLQMAVIGLQKAEDFTGPDAERQLEAARQAAETAIGRLEASFAELEQSRPDDSVRQAIRNARLEAQSAKETLATARPDMPDAAIQALRDLHRAAAEVRSSTELAAEPRAPGRPAD